jgi:outer membrane protein OmpA-like peptidoglycan-associated protein
MPKRRLAMVSGLAALFMALPASAQTSSAPYDTNIDFQQFRPAPGPYNFFTVQGSRVEGRTALSLGAWANYAYRPLTIFNANCPSAVNDSGCTVGDVRSRPIEHLATLNLLVGVTLANRILLSLDLPLTLETGQAVERSSGRPVLDASSTAQSQTAGGLGDPRVEAKVRLAGSGLTGAGLAVSGFVTIPLGQSAGAGDHFVADHSSTFGGRLIGEYRRGRFAIALNLGAIGRPSSLTLYSTEVGSRLTWGAALGVDISPRLSVMAEGFGASDLSSQLQNNNAEVLGGARYRIGDLTFTAGGGSGVLRGAGSPTARAFLGVAWAPYRVDNDGDGVADNVDRCPAEAEDLDGYEDEDGCPEFDNDGDGVNDTSDRCPDQAEDRDNFQDADGCPDNDNDNDGVPDGYDSCPREAEDRDGDHDEDGCPDNDRDHDGVQDDQDRCPGEPEDTDGFQDTDGCPDPDNDGDGIPDTEDQCSDQAGPASGHGCPAAAADRDRDGVPDDRDRCPDQAETVNGVDDADGCPEQSGPTLARIVGDQIQVMGSVNFERARDRIEGAGSFQVLESVLTILRTHPEIARVEVQGHTDNVGNAERNTALSERRAEAVRRWLVEHGIEAGRVTAHGYGPARPLESNSSEAGRARNRRVEFFILPATPAAP